MCTLCSIVRQGHKSLFVAGCNNLPHTSSNKEAEWLPTTSKVETIVWIYSSGTGCNWKGDLKRKPDLVLMFRAKLPSMISSSLACRWHSPTFIANEEGNLWGDGESVRNSSQTREAGCVDFLFLSRIGLCEYSLILLTLSWFEKVTLSLNADSWLLLFAYLVMSLEYLILAADLWYPRHCTQGEGVRRLRNVREFCRPALEEVASSPNPITQWWIFPPLYRSDGGFSSLYRSLAWVSSGITVNALDIITEGHLWLVWQRYLTPRWAVEGIWDHAEASELGCPLWHPLEWYWGSLVRPFPGLTPPGQQCGQGERAVCFWVANGWWAPRVQHWAAPYV